ncbi:MAG: M6 family metalloprotease domain-containing protein [Endomicrobiaceae bacterium]|nr:M6 family metalloprotease domain-containing protein [Endomicrobiaceae bacterium]
MKKLFILTLSIIFNFVFCDFLFSVPANPEPIDLVQPDGTKITVKLYGDEFYNWFEDLNGYTVIKDTDTGFWKYAEEDSSGELVPSENVVGKINPSSIGVQKSLKDKNQLNESISQRKQFDADLRETLALYEVSNDEDSSEKVSRVQSASSATGTKTNLVLLIQFSDLKFKDNPPFRNASDETIITGFYNLFNKEHYTTDGAVGSVKDYFKEISYGKLQYNSVISPIITLNFDDETKNSYRYYSYESKSHSDISYERTRNMIKQALKQLHDSGYDFSELWSGNAPEGFTVIHAGGGAESGNYDFIWSHKWQFDIPVVYDGIKFTTYHISPAGRGRNGDSGLIRIGVICHESLHFFGLPDLYDTKGNTGGLGNFCVMSGGNWNGSSGNSPAHPCAWAKNKLGWISPQRAVYGVNSIGESATEEDAFYIFKPSSFDSREYFLMENRQKTGFDKELPGSTRGLLIYHIDERQKGNNLILYDNYMVQLEEAGSRTSNWRNFPLIKNTSSGSDSDYFRSGTVSYFSDDCVSSPNSRSYKGLISGIKISAISSSSSLMTFIYGQDIVIIDDLSSVVCYPNPARNGVVNIINLPTDTKDFSAEIFTLTAKLVRSFSENDIEYTSDGFKKIKWDCKNDSGQDVAPGVYLVMIKNNSKKKIFKVAVIR